MSLFSADEFRRPAEAHLGAEPGDFTLFGDYRLNAGMQTALQGIKLRDAAVLIGVVFVGAGIVGLVTDGTGIVTSLFLAALGVVCLIAAVLRVRAHRSGQRTTDGGAADLSVD